MFVGMQLTGLPRMPVPKITTPWPQFRRTGGEKGDVLHLVPGLQSHESPASPAGSTLPGSRPVGCHAISPVMRTGSWAESLATAHTIDR